jgi:hypothetical protein
MDRIVTPRQTGTQPSHAQHAISDKASDRCRDTLCPDRNPGLEVPEDLIAAAVHAVDDMGNIISHQCAVDPETLTRDRITAYALAPIRLRECASAAGLERLIRRQA